MTTYILGAGASRRAGYPLCAELWPRVVEHQTKDSEFRDVVNLVRERYGDVKDVEGAFTDLEHGRGVFSDVADRDVLMGAIRRGIKRCFVDICRKNSAPLYRALAAIISEGDVVVTLNYDVSLERELIASRKFRVRNGYGFNADWDEPDSDVTVLKPHGSINWIGCIGRPGPSSHARGEGLGTHPLIDNREKLFSGYPQNVLERGAAGSGVTEAEITLILPTHEKQFRVKTSRGDEWPRFYDSLWDQAATALQQSDRIVIIGYSLPAADQRARAVFLSSAQKHAEIVLCCKDSNSDLKEEFERHGHSRVRDGGTLERFVGTHDDS